MYINTQNITINEKSSKYNNSATNWREFFSISLHWIKSCLSFWRWVTPSHIINLDKNIGHFSLKFPPWNEWQDDCHQWCRNTIVTPSPFVRAFVVESLVNCTVFCMMLSDTFLLPWPIKIKKSVFSVQYIYFWKFFKKFLIVANSLAHNKARTWLLSCRETCYKINHVKF